MTAPTRKLVLHAGLYAPFRRTAITLPGKQQKLVGQVGLVSYQTTMAKTVRGQCYCGAVEIEMSGDPLEVGYCHCENCRHYSAAPVSAFTLWKKEDFKVTKGEGLL